MAKPKQIKPLGQRSAETKMMLVAPPGFGKTVFGASGEDVLFLTTDPEGTESAYFMGLEADEWEARSSKDVYECYEYLLGEGQGEYRWLVVDNIGQVQKIFRRRSMEEGRKRNPNRDEFVPSLDDHQRSQLEIESFVNRVNDLDMSVLWIAHQELNEDSDGEIFFSPAIHGQKGAVAQSIAGLMKIVAYGEVVEEDDKEIRRFWFSHFGPFRGKDRFNAMGPYRDDLTLARMDEILEKKREDAKAKRSKPKTAVRRTPTRRASTATSSAKSTTNKPVTRAKRVTSTGKKK